MKTLLILMLAGQSLDITTTIVGINRGCREVAPFYRHLNRYVIAGAKGGSALYISFSIPRWNKSHPKLTKTLLVAGAASGFTAGALNIRTLPHCTSPP